MTPFRRLARARRAWLLAALFLPACAMWHEHHVPWLDGPVLKEYVTREGDVGRCVMGAKLPQSYEVKRPSYTLRLVPHASFGDTAPDFEVTLRGPAGPTARALGAEMHLLGQERDVKRYRLTASSDGPFQIMVMVEERMLGSEELIWRVESCHSLTFGG